MGPTHLFKVQVWNNSVETMDGTADQAVYSQFLVYCSVFLYIIDHYHHYHSTISCLRSHLIAFRFTSTFQEAIPRVMPYI